MMKNYLRVLLSGGCALLLAAPVWASDDDAHHARHAAVAEDKDTNGRDHTKMRYQTTLHDVVTRDGAPKKWVKKCARWDGKRYKMNAHYKPQKIKKNMTAQNTAWGMRRAPGAMGDEAFSYHGEIRFVKERKGKQRVMKIRYQGLGVQGVYLSYGIFQSKYCMGLFTSKVL